MSGPDSQLLWNDWQDAIRFANDCFAKWKEEGLIRVDEYDAIAAYNRKQLENGKQAQAKGEPFPQDLPLPRLGQCWSCEESAMTAEDGFGAGCGATVQPPSVTKYRYLVNLCHEIKSHEEAGRLRLAHSHA